jgi:uncharacterized membrane protein
LTEETRKVWLRYARWLVAALTLQLAADIIERSVTTSWQKIGRLAAIAVIRTFLNYFARARRRAAAARGRDRSRSEQANPSSGA